jgi:GMP synthase (glutamine-hydrolysing)
MYSEVRFPLSKFSAAEIFLLVDGVMRLNECEQVQKDLSEHLGINLTVVDASQQFLDGLRGIEDPEKKRKFIGMFSI